MRVPSRLVRRSSRLIAVLLVVPLYGAVVEPGYAQADASGAARQYVAWERAVNMDSANHQIVVSDPAGRHIRELTATNDRQSNNSLDASPNGKLIAFVRTDAPSYDKPRLMVIRADGRGERAVPVKCTDPCIRVNDPTWTPDGRHLVFIKTLLHKGSLSHELWRTDLRGRHVNRVTRAKIARKYDEFGASFAPNGSMLFHRTRRGDGLTAVFTSNPKGRHARRLTAWPLDIHDASISPTRSGRSRNLLLWSAYRQDQGTAVVTARVPRKGKLISRVRYLTANASGSSPSWSPNGRRIAFAHLVNIGNFHSEDIWTMSWNGHHKRQLSRSSLNESGPTWGRYRH